MLQSQFTIQILIEVDKELFQISIKSHHQQRQLK